MCSFMALLTDITSGSDYVVEDTEPVGHRSWRCLKIFHLSLLEEDRARQEKLSGCPISAQLDWKSVISNWRPISAQSLTCSYVPLRGFANEIADILRKGNWLCDEKHPSMLSAFNHLQHNITTWRVRNHRMFDCSENCRVTAT